jgi:hypothetical protein
MEKVKIKKAFQIFTRFSFAYISYRFLLFNFVILLIYLEYIEQYRKNILIKLLSFLNSYTFALALAQ